MVAASGARHSQLRLFLAPPSLHLQACIPTGGLRMMNALQLAPSRYVSDQFDALAENLRGMMLAGLQRVLSPDHDPATLLSLENGAARLFEDLLSHSVDAQKARPGAQAFGKLFLVTTPPTLSPTQSTLLAGKAAPGRRARLRIKLLNLFRPRRRVPLELAPDAAHFADLWQFHIFAHFAIQARVAHALQRHLSGRVLLWPPDKLPPRLETATFWWLASLGCAGPGGLKRQIATLADALSQRAGWAGFWDQYVLRLAHENGAQLPQSAPDLPLVASADAALATPPDDDAAQARKGWRLEAPAYAPALLGQGF